MVPDTADLEARSISLGRQQNMQLEEDGKESCTTIFSSSTDLNLLKLTAKPQLHYARNNSQMKQIVEKKKADLDP